VHCGLTVHKKTASVQLSVFELRQSDSSVPVRDWRFSKAG